MNWDLITDAFAGQTEEEAPSELVLAGPALLPAIGITVTTALRRISDLYQSLQLQAGRIMDVYGSKIPCSVQTRHNEAVSAYLRAARVVINQIQSDPSMQVLQQLVDAKGAVIGQKLGGRPVIPMTFSSAENCAGSGPVTGAFGNPLGLVVVRIVLWVLAAGTVVATVNQVMSHWPGGDVDAAEGHKIWVNTRLDCIGRLRKEQGLLLAEAEKACAKIGGETQPKGTGGISTVAILGVTGLVVGAIAVALLSGKGRRDIGDQDEDE